VSTSAFVNRIAIKKTARLLPLTMMPLGATFDDLAHFFCFALYSTCPRVENEPVAVCRVAVLMKNRKLWLPVRPSDSTT